MGGGQSQNAANNNNNNVYQVKDEKTKGGGETTQNNRHPYGCHFSSPMDIKFERWITNHGIIHRVQMLQ